MKSDIQTIDNYFKNENLKLPEYQRPYKWTIENINQLIDDILLFNDKDAYRLGTIVLHEYIDENKKTNFNIVDGQQRTISLLLIAYAIQEDNKLKEYLINTMTINWEFTNSISQQNIQKNYKEIQRRLKDFDEKTIKFLFEKCEVVVVTLNDISEAFQFFDSQNARGKDLEPHDLLKAFHLREMKNINDNEKSKIIQSWEEMKTEILSDIFSKYLYRIRNWSQGKSARYFTKNDIGVFKGIKLEDKNKYHYSKIHTIANYYTENYNKEYHRSIDNNYIDYPFQIDQPIINGKRFFEMISYYQNIINNLKKLEDKLEKDKSILNILNNYEGKSRTGDKYIRNLFDCALLYYIDKFGKIELDKAIEKIFIWTYKRRLELHSVQIASMDNYALQGKKLFVEIRDAVSHKEIINISLDSVEYIKASKVTEIKNKFEELKYVKT